VRIEPAARVDDDATLEWFRQYRRTGNRTLRNTLCEHYIELARALARRFANRNEPIDDLEQVAMLGVLKAVERFDPDFGTPFAAFAVPTVVGELRRHFRDHGWMVRVPRRIQNLHHSMGSLVTELAQDLERSPTVAEIAVAAGVSEEDVLEALEAANCYRPAALESSAPGGNPAERVRLVDDDLESAERPRDAAASARATPAPATTDRLPALLRGPDPGRDRQRARHQSDAGLAAARSQHRDTGRRRARGLGPSAGLRT